MKKERPKNQGEVKVMVGSTVYGFENELQGICNTISTFGYQVLNSHLGKMKVDPRKSNLENCLKNCYKEPAWRVEAECFYLDFPGFILGSPASEGVNTPSLEGVNEGVKKLYQLISRQPGQKSNALSQQLNKSQSTVERWLKELKEKGFIRFEGAPKTGGYFIVENEN